MEMKDNKIILYLLYGQSIYYLLTGIWPLLHIESFMAVTGPKNDIWLVQTVGVMIIAVALSLFFAARTKSYYLPTMVLGISAALGLMFVDVVFFLKGDISGIYLADAFAEFLLVLGWGYFIVKYGKDPSLISPDDLP
jgi:hypothetical protein